MYPMKSRSAIRALAGCLRRYRVTPDAFTFAISHNEHWKCVVCSILGLPTEPIVHRNCRDLFCLLRFRINSAMTKLKSSATNARRAPTSEWQMGNVARFGWQNRGWNMPQLLCLLDHIFIGEFINSHKTTFLCTDDWACGSTCRSFGHDSSRSANRFLRNSFDDPTREHVYSASFEDSFPALRAHVLNEGTTLVLRL